MTSRRFFLKNSALAMVGVGTAPLWLSRALYADTVTARKKILVVIFQRGAVDGLNMVVPFGEKSYYALRPTIAVPAPTRDSGSIGAIDLDGFFGLHPNLSPLKPLWDRKELAVVHAAGSPDPTRSHFDAQFYMESGTPGLKNAAGGWLNRALPTEPAPSPLRAVSLTPELPVTLRGTTGAIAMQDIASFDVRDKRMSSVFESLYDTTPDKMLNSTGRESFEAVKLLQSIEKTPYAPSNGAAYPKGRLGQNLSQIARLVKSNVGVEVAFAEIGGWDTHVQEMGKDATIGQLPNLLRDFGGALAAFSQDLGDRMEDVVVVTMSEFGRTVAENGTRGTDHGHANCMLVLGGGVRGGKVHGRWPGLAAEQLYEGRDLALTTDFRTVLSQLIRQQMGNPRLAGVFPNFTAATSDVVLG